MKTVKISEYIADHGQNPFYDGSSVFAMQTPSFIKESNFQTVLSAVIDQMYGEYTLLNRYAEKQDTIPQTATIVYATNGFRYEGLYKSMNFDFDPLENYNMTETYTGNETGHVENTMDYGQQIRTAEYGGQKTSQNYGQATETTNVSPFDSQTFTPERQTVGSARNDSLTSDAHTDKITDGGKTDITSGDNNVDTTHTLIRRGNIGVTTSTQLASDYQRYVNFSLYKIIAEDIMKIICNRFLSVSECADY